MNIDMAIPYFMTNDKWYYFTDDSVKLTDEGKKIPKVVKSYNDYLKELEYLKNIDANLGGIANNAILFL